MALTEYLYIDENRLDSYFEQISAPVHYDKIPSWKISLSAIPGIETSIDKQGRQFTKHEKITSLLKYLEKEALLNSYRPCGENVEVRARNIFRLETCRAIKVSIPSGSRVAARGHGFNVWISYMPYSKHRNPNEGKPYRAGVLYLLEKVQADDGDNTIGWTTPYSALHAFLSKSQKEITTASVARLPSADSDQGVSFSSHPDKVLNALGAIIGQARRIRTLYRVRANNDARYSRHEKSVVTIGYPIFIAEAK